MMISEVNSIVCDVCQGIGFVGFEKDKVRYSKPCDCQKALRVDMRLKRAHIPVGFENASLANFKRREGLRDANEILMQCRNYIKEYIPCVTKNGPMFVGDVGLGKTHLAVAIARELIIDKGVNVQFVDLQHLTQELRASYGKNSDETEDDILDRIWKADLVVLDDLGRQRRTEWVEDTMEIIIGKLYNNPKTLMVTTNFSNEGMMEGISYLERTAKRETLGDRIGKRMWSRLQELCWPEINLSGTDYRREKPRF